MQALGLLTDGTVMVQSGNNASSNTWFLLSPTQTGNTFPGTTTNTGNYVNGVWSSLANSGTFNSPPELRLFNTSAVLPSGNFFTIGGEYTTPQPFTGTSEIFTPSTSGGPGSWAVTSTIPTPPTSIRFTSNVITGASNTSPITITAVNTAGLTNGEKVTISGVGGNTAANNTFTIANLTPTTFDLVGSTGNGAYTSGGNFSVSQFGDDPIELLPGGKILAGWFNGPQTYIYDPATDTWTQTSNNKLRNDGSDEETWMKLPPSPSSPQGSILSYDIFGSISANAFKAQRYDIATDTWVDASQLSMTNPPGLLSDGPPPASAMLPGPGDAQGDEMGPAFLLPNGNAIFFGGNGKTAIYNSTTNTWSAGPDQPTRSVSSTISGATNISGTITGTTGNGVAITITTTANGTAGMSNGDLVTISGVTGNTNANGTWTISGLTSSSFQLTPVAQGQSGTGNGAYTGGGTWFDAIKITAANTTGLSNGQLVTIAGVNGNTAANGNWTIANVTGTSFQLVGPQGNAAYTSGGTWSSSQLSLDDAPGCIMPNGDILLGFSPLGGLGAGGGYTFPAPTYIYEFDPTNGTFLDVTPGGTSISDNQDFLFMIALPSGQVLLDNQAGPGGIQIYSPVGQPQDAWRPVITGIAHNSGTNYTMTGTQLTGISEGASFGDEATMATNYPIIQLTDSAGNVTYVRTTNWNNTGVQTGAATETVQFALPTGTTLSDYTSIIVTANGIASLPASPVALGNTDENVTVQVDPNDSTKIQIVVTNTSTVVATYDNNSANPIAIAGDANSNEVTINEANGVVNTPVSFDGGGSSGAPGDRMIVLGTTGNDTLDVTPGSATSASMTFDGSRVYSFANIQKFDFNGRDGDDKMIVDSSAGLLGLSGGIHYDGGTGFNSLQLVQTGGTTRTSDTYSPGPNPGQGTDTIDTQTVSFENLAPVLDLVHALAFTVNGTSANNAISYVPGAADPINDGLVTVDNFESIEFANKLALSINTGPGTDTVSLNNANTPALLSSITVTGGDPHAQDALLVNGIAPTVAVDTVGQMITGATGSGGAVPISYFNIKSLSVDAGLSTSLAVSGSHTYTYTPTTALDGGTIQTDALPITFSGFGPGKTLALTGFSVGTDSIVVNGTMGNDTFTVAATTGDVTLSGRATIAPAMIPNLTLNGLGGNDIFNLTAPEPYTAITVAGGGPGTTNLVGDGTTANVTLGATATVVGAGLGNVTVRGCAVLTLAAGAGDLAVTGGSGPDAFNVDLNATDTTSITDGPAFTATNTGALVLTGSSSSSANSLVLTTHSAAQTTYTPQSPTSGSIATTPLIRNVQFSGIEAFTYNGSSGNAALTVVGNSAANAFMLTPGAANDAGLLSMDTTLPVAFQNLGASGKVIVNANGGADSLIYNGTAVNDTFSIASNASPAGGQVTLNARVPVITTAVQTLTLEGLGGDDTFTLVPTIAASPYTTLNLHGGSQASAAGDQANLTAGAAADIAVSGQVVSQSGVTVAGSGLENINLNGAGNRLIYNGVAGVTENINVMASPTANQGLVSVPGVTQVTFTNVPAFVVNGNPADSDTLTFSGTNNSDTFKINLAAAGTAADPVLKLQTSATAALLLTLQNYTGFTTLNVGGLDGADTFNVYTGPTAPSDPNLPGGRNVFINGTLPSGKKKGTDLLHIYYTPQRPKIVQTVATQNPTSGQVKLDYGTALYLVGYAGIENVTIGKQ